MCLREVASYCSLSFPLSWRGERRCRGQVLSIHLIQERRGVPGDGHGRALDHGAGRGARGQPLLLFPPLSLLLLQPLLGHLAPVDGSVAVGPARTRGQREMRQENLPALPPRGGSNPIMMLPQKSRKAMETGHGYEHPELLTLAAASAWSWMMAVTGRTGGWCWPGAGTGAW